MPYQEAFNFYHAFFLQNGDLNLSYAAGIKAPSPISRKSWGGRYFRKHDPCSSTNE